MIIFVVFPCGFSKFSSILCDFTNYLFFIFFQKKQNGKTEKKDSSDDDEDGDDLDDYERNAVKRIQHVQDNEISDNTRDLLPIRSKEGWEKRSMEVNNGE